MLICCVILLVPCHGVQEKLSLRELKKLSDNLNSHLLGKHHVLIDVEMLADEFNDACKKNEGN